MEQRYLRTLDTRFKCIAAHGVLQTFALGPCMPLIQNGALPHSEKLKEDNPFKNSITIRHKYYIYASY